MANDSPETSSEFQALYTAIRNKMGDDAFPLLNRDYHVYRHVGRPIPVDPREPIGQRVKGLFRQGQTPFSAIIDVFNEAPGLLSDAAAQDAFSRRLSHMRVQSPSRTDEPRVLSFDISQYANGLVFAMGELAEPGEENRTYEDAKILLGRMGIVGPMLARDERIGARYRGIDGEFSPEGTLKLANFMAELTLDSGR